MSATEPPPEGGPDPDHAGPDSEPTAASADALPETSADGAHGAHALTDPVEGGAPESGSADAEHAEVTKHAVGRESAGAGGESGTLGLENVEAGENGTIEARGTPDLSGLQPHAADALHAPDSPTTSLITSLRSQLLALSEQMHMLNTKLVSAVSQRGDLEDQLYTLQDEHTARGAKVEELERAKAQWEEHMSKGLLVEREQITAEMQRLAAGLVEEERRRGSAEEKRAQVEGEVDELAATLFDQANTMVATERMARAQAEDRLRETEENLAAAESAMRDMQQHLQSLSSTSNPTDTSRSSADASALVPSPSGAALAPAVARHLASHVPYAEFITFLHHLRALRPIRERSKETFPPPLISALMGQPFLARTAIEDHEPTLRLDLAPDLSWLSRRSVGAAIIAGDLIIEPVPASQVIVATSGPIDAIGCSLCGRAIFPSASTPLSPSTGHGFGAPPTHPLLSSRSAQSSSGARFSLKPFFNTSPGPAASPSSSPIASPAPITASGRTSTDAPSASTTPTPGAPGLAPGSSTSSTYPPVYIFRVAAAAQGDKEAKSYPLCKSGWCLERLRATCAMWHFLRTGIIHVVWHGDDVPSTYATASATAPTPSAAPSAAGVETEDPRRDSGEPGSADTAHTAQLEAPALPTRRKSGWGLGFKLGERSSSSSSWTKAFNRSSGGTGAVSVGATPPQSPGLGSTGGKLESTESAPATASVAVDPSLDATDEKGQLGAPLELKVATISDEEKLEQSGETEEVVSVPTIQQTEASPETAAPGKASVAGSAASDIDSDAENTFSTPKGEPNELGESGEAGEAGEAGDAGEAGEGGAEAAAANETADALDRILNMAGGDEDEDKDKDGEGNAGESRKEGDEEAETGDSKAETTRDAAAADNTESTPTKPQRTTPLGDSKGTTDSNSTTVLDTPTRPSASGSATSLVDYSPITRSATSTPPPPLPKRAAARNRLSQLSVADSPARAGPATGTAEPSPLSASATASEPASATESSDPVSAVDNPVEEKADSSTSAIEAVGPKSPPPPLPPRHPKHPETPSSQIVDSQATTTAVTTASATAVPAGAGATTAVTAGGRTYLPEDGWEAKTWRAIIKLREDMWRARVGLVVDQ